MLRRRCEIEADLVLARERLQVDGRCRQDPQAGVLAGEDVEADVVQLVARRLLEPLGREEPRPPGLDLLAGLLLVQLAEASRLAAQVGQGLRVREVLEQPDRDRGRDDPRDDDAREEEGR